MPLVFLLVSKRFHNKVITSFSDAIHGLPYCENLTLLFSYLHDPTMMQIRTSYNVTTFWISVTCWVFSILWKQPQHSKVEMWHEFQNLWLKEQVLCTRREFLCQEQNIYWKPQTWKWMKMGCCKNLQRVHSSCAACLGPLPPDLRWWCRHM